MDQNDKNKVSLKLVMKKLIIQANDFLTKRPYPAK